MKVGKRSRKFGSRFLFLKRNPNKNNFNIGYLNPNDPEAVVIEENCHIYFILILCVCVQFCVMKIKLE